MFRVLASITQDHDWRLVILAGIICLFASFAALSLLVGGIGFGLECCRDLVSGAVEVEGVVALSYCLPRPVNGLNRSGRSSRRGRGHDVLDRLLVITKRAALAVLRRQ